MFRQASIRHRSRLTAPAIRAPSRKLEYAYYGAVIYSVMAPAVGLDIPVLAGLMIVVIAARCMMQLQSCARIYRPIGLLLACAVSLISIQILIHGESILGQPVRVYAIWILSLIIVHSLCVRPGFSLRFPLVLFGIGLVTIPFIGIGGGELDMARVDIDVQGGLTHPGGLAEWFGFFAIYFAVIGVHARRGAFRTGAWVLMVGCLFIVTLTIERSPLFATALAITVAFRRLLKRGFAPVFFLLLLSGVIYETGLFAPAILKYSERGLEDSGRGVIWPEAIRRISESPVFGVGESNISMQFGKSAKELLPHSTFLHLALSSGILPCALFLAFWVQAFFKAIADSRDDVTSQMRLPFLVFTLVPVILGDWAYMSPWALLTISVGAGAIVSHQTRPAAAVKSIRRSQQIGLRRWQTRTAKVR